MSTAGIPEIANHEEVVVRGKDLAHFIYEERLMPECFGCLPYQSNVLAYLRKIFSVKSIPSLLPYPAEFRSRIVPFRMKILRPVLRAQRPGVSAVAVVRLACRDTVIFGVKKDIHPQVLQPYCSEKSGNLLSNTPVPLAPSSAPG